MLLRQVCVTLPLLLLLTAFAPAPFPRHERRTESGNDMVGTWVGLVVTHDRFTYNPQYDYALKVNSRTSPKTYDITGIGSATRGREFRGIYKIEGDVLILSYNVGAGPRPTAFEGQGRGEHVESHKRRRAEDFAR
jgi:uncharacterized protein (TIGR03067 family)